MQNLNAQFEALRQSPTVAMYDRVSALKASGRRIIGLQVGDPDFTTPQPVMDVALKAMQAGLTHYAPSRGFPDLRLAAATKLSRDNGVSYDPQNEILITHGGIHAYYLAMQSILNPGDDVLIPDPSWTTHANMTTMLRGKVIRVPGPAENAFVPYFESWEQALTSRTRAIVLNYPSNPTGAYPTREYLQKLQDFAAEHDLWIVSDEVYENLHYDEKPTSAAAFEGSKERTILVNSLSKTYAMTGWRLGYAIMPEALAERVGLLLTHSIGCTATFTQFAGIEAITSSQEVVEAMVAEYQRRRDRMVAGLNAIPGVRCQVPQGAFYAFPNVKACGVPVRVLASRLLEEANVAVLPGTDFGQFGEGYLRLCYATSLEKIDRALERIAAVM